MWNLLFRAFARRIAIPLLQRLRCESSRRWVQFVSIIFVKKERQAPRYLASTTAQFARDQSKVTYLAITPECSLDSSKSPETCEDELHWSFSEKKKEHPPLFVATLPKASVIGSNGAVVCEQTLLGDLASEWFFTPEKNTLRFRLSLPKATILNGRCATIASASAGTYFHWLFDALPRIALLQQANHDISEFDHLIVNACAAPFQLESLEHLTIAGGKLVRLNQKTHYQCDQLIAPSLPGRPGAPPLWALQFLRNRFLPAAKAPFAKSERIYISRAGSAYRKFTNEEQVKATLQAHGFREVFLEKLTFMEQVSLFATMTCVVAGHGAGLSNLVFSSPGTKVLEIFSPDYVNNCFWHIAEALELDYHYLIGSGKRPPPFVDPHRVEKDIIVDIDRLELALKRLDVQGED